MASKDVMKWNTRFSALYALGVWTMIGSVAYFKHTGYFERLSEKKEEMEEETQNPNQVVLESGNTKTVIVYKENHTPFTTKIYNFMKSF